MGWKSLCSLATSQLPVSHWDAHHSQLSTQTRQPAQNNGCFPPPLPCTGTSVVPLRFGGYWLMWWVFPKSLVPQDRSTEPGDLGSAHPESSHTALCQAWFPEVQTAE